MIGMLIAAAPLMVAPVPKEMQFGDWVVACDNGRHCEALALPPVDGSEDWTFYVSRSAKASNAPKVDLSPAFGSWDDNIIEVRLAMDGRKTEYRFNERGMISGKSMALVTSLAKARKVEILSPSGATVGTVRVKGASAALRWIDERQMRVGTVTAIIASGPKPMTSVPPPPALPRIPHPPFSNSRPKQLSPANALAIQSLGSEYCDSDRAEATTYRLDAKHTLGIVGCMLGAYQGTSIIVIIDESGKWKPALIEQAEATGEYSEPVDAYLLTGADFDEQTKRLSMAAKGRGLADCGSSASWVWDGKMFRLASYQSLGVCRGAPPGTWFSRWQTANDPLKDK